MISKKELKEEKIQAGFKMLASAFLSIALDLEDEEDEDPPLDYNFQIFDKRPLNS